MLWDKILAEYRIPDAGGLEILAQACELSDRIQRLSRRIEVTGEVVQRCIRSVRGCSNRPTSATC